MKRESHARSLELRDIEVQEIIDRPPKALIRWGLTVYLFVFILFGFLTSLIRYPDIVKAKVIITTEPAPINLVSRMSGKIYLLRADNHNVGAGDHIGFIESSANPKDILVADSLTRLSDSLFNDFSQVLVLGEIQNAFSQWEKARENRNLLYRNNIVFKQIQNLEGQIKHYRTLARSQFGQLKIKRDELFLAKNRFRIDSVLYQQKVNTSVDFSKAKAEFLSQQREERSLEIALINTDIQIDALEKQITELGASKLASNEQINLELKQSKRELQAQILKWKESYLFIAPSNGSLSYLNFLQNGKFVESGKPMFSVIPISKEIVGMAELPIAGSGKVKVGQSVNIRLENFPFEQYGMLKGIVKEISSLPSQDKYLVKVDLPDTLRTMTNNSLQFKPQMQGEAEIITEDISLVDRIFYHFLKALRIGY